MGNCCETSQSNEDPCTIQRKPVSIRNIIADKEKLDEVEWFEAMEEAEDRVLELSGIN